MSLQFGFCVPPFAMPGPAFFRTPSWTALEPARAVDAAVEAERLGFDSVWMADHLMHGHDGAILEGWTTLSVIAGRTSRVRLGTIHLAQPFRHPAILAKMVGTLDALSGGRLILFYDCGWGETEVRAYGLDWPPEVERIERMEEGLRLMYELWTAHEPLDFRGRFFRTDRAICRPAPVQPGGRPPIWLGEARSDRWADAVASYADGWNSVPASPERLAEKIETIKAAFARANRDFASLELSLETQVLVAPTEADLRDTVRRIAALPGAPGRKPRADVLAALEDASRPLADALPDWLAGTPEQVAEKVRRYAAMGVSHFMGWFVDFPSDAGMRLFAEKVIPALRSSATG
ncbi:MAG TPA: LLM class flavin-dependent oxidoreductase [Chloroflexota bacterium]|nr:LLM class flavin-dependent oxidoreductase [Chloroflexota bacterium]